MKDLLATIELYDDDDTRVGFAKGTQQGRTTAGTFDKVYNMAEIRKLGKELNVSEVIDGVKLDPDKFRSNVTKAKARTDFYKNQFKSLSPKKQKEFKKDFMKQIAKHQDGGFYISAANRVPNAKLVKKYFPKANDPNKIVTSINGILLNEFKNKGNVIKTSPKANANAIRVEDLRKITDPSFETFEGVQGTKGASLQHVASKNRMVTLNNLAYMDKVLNSSLSQNDKRIKIIENEVDRLIKAKPKNYVERVNALNNEGMALASGYIKKDGKIVKGPTAGYSEFRIKDPLNEKLSYFGKDDAKTILPNRDSVLIQEDADLIDKPVKDYTPDERKRAIEIAKKKQVEFKKAGKLEKNIFSKYAAIGCPGKAKGGRIEFNLGGSTQCIAKGLEKVRSGTNLSPGDQANIRSINNITKTAKGAKAVGNAARILGAGVIAPEIVFGGFFAATDYATGANKDEIISNLTFGLGGQSMKEQLKESDPRYGQADKLTDVYQGYLSSLNKLGEPKQYVGRPGKRTSEQDVLKAMEPFTRVNPQTETGDFFDLGMYESQLQKDRGSEAKFAEDKMQRALERGFYDPGVGGSRRISEFQAAGGGIAKEAGDPSGRPPESGPQPQGLLSLKNRVRNY